MVERLALFLGGVANKFRDEAVGHRDGSRIRFGKGFVDFHSNKIRRESFIGLDGACNSASPFGNGIRGFQESGLPCVNGR